MQTSLMPKTVDRLFMASVVLSTVVLTYTTVWAGMSTYDTVYTICIFLWLGAVMANHLALYLLAKRPSSRVSISADGKARYPECLLSLSNIIFTFTMALGLIGSMWAPLWRGMAALVYDLKHHDGPRVRYSFPVWTRGITGLFAYGESIVLLTLLTLYVRQRRFHQSTTHKSASSSTDDLSIKA